jgi:hypothetical protein
MDARGSTRLHNARRSHAEPLALKCLFLKSGDGVENLRFRREGGPIQFDARRTGARSLRLPQRIITSFVQAQDFAAVEALMPDLKRCAEGFERPQSFDNGWPQPLSQSAGSSRGSWCALPETVQRERCSRRAACFGCNDAGCKVTMHYEVRAPSLHVREAR